MKGMEMKIIEKLKTETLAFTNLDTGEPEPAEVYRPADIAEKLNELIENYNELVLALKEFTKK